MLLSIVTVTRDNRAGLARTAASLASQQGEDFEWIIIDGGSRDGTEHDLPGYDAIAVSESDLGPFDGMNRGIDRATGEYLLFLNSGDLLSQSDTLREIAVAIRQSRPDFLYGDSWEAADDKTWYKPARPAASRALGMFTHHQAMLYKRSVVGSQRYDLGYRIAADYDFTLRFLRKSITCTYLPLPICIFEAGGLSQRNVALGRREQFTVRRRNRLTMAAKNLAIYLAQMAIWNLRAHAPELYWQLKRGRRTAPREP